MMLSQFFVDGDVINGIICPVLTCVVPSIHHVGHMYGLLLWHDHVMCNREIAIYTEMSHCLVDFVYKPIGKSRRHTQFLSCNLMII